MADFWDFLISFQALFVAVVGLVSGVIGSFINFWGKWFFEEKSRVREERKNAINSLYNISQRQFSMQRGEHYYDIARIVNSKSFSKLKSDLSEAIIEKLTDYQSKEALVKDNLIDPQELYEISEEKLVIALRDDLSRLIKKWGIL